MILNYGSFEGFFFENSSMNLRSNFCHLTRLLFEKLLMKMSNFLFKDLFLEMLFSALRVQKSAHLSQNAPNENKINDKNNCFIDKTPFW